MSSWQSEMTPEEWESVMGVPYSHISPEQQEKNRQFSEGFKRGLQELFEFRDGIWTRCGDDSKGTKNDSSMVTNSITCYICKEEESWQEPEDSTSTNLMPDGAFTNGSPGEWVCLDCIYCKECTEDLLEDECICEPKITLGQGEE